MKSEIVGEQKNKTFPRLMTYSDDSSYVFFVTGFDDNGGMIGVSIGPKFTGRDAGELTSDNLIDFGGVIQLSND